MKNRTCSIEGCDGYRASRGWCTRHYDRWRKYGDPLEPSRGHPIREFLTGDLAAIDRLMSHIAVTPGPLDTDCWLSTYAKSQAGYTHLWVAVSRRTAPAHRVAYSALVGPIPDGLHLDHLCRVRHCVNPDHLQPVTAIQNVRRGAAARRGIDIRRYLMFND